MAEKLNDNLANKEDIKKLLGKEVSLLDKERVQPSILLVGGRYIFEKKATSSSFYYYYNIIF